MYRINLITPVTPVCKLATRQRDRLTGRANARYQERKPARDLALAAARALRALVLARPGRTLVVRERFVPPSGAVVRPACFAIFTDRPGRPKPISPFLLLLLPGRARLRPAPIGPCKWRDRE